MKLKAAAGVLWFLAATAQADVVTYDCSLQNLEKGWISERVILSVDADTNRARVLDAYINQLEGRPKDASFKTLRNGEFRINWKMKIPMTRGGTAYASYTAKLNPETQKLSLVARFPQVNASNRPRGNGTCQILSGQSLYVS